MACGDCDFVIVDGVSLPGVSGIEERPVYIGDAERSVSGVLRPNFRTVAREWTVLLSGVSGVETRLLEEHLRTLGEVLVNVQGVECFALVTVNSKVRVPRLHSSWRGERDLVRSNWEILIRESQVETVLPGVSYAYQAFTDVGAFTWDWDAAGQPAEVDVLLVAGGGGGGGHPYTNAFGAGGGGAGGVLLATQVSASGNISGTVGAGGAPETNGSNTTFGGLTAIGGGAGASSTAGINGGEPGHNGGSGGGSSGGRTPGAGTSGQGQAGGHGGSRARPLDGRIPYSGGGGGGGAGARGADGGASNGRDWVGEGGNGGNGLDLLALGWNYRLIEGVPRFIGGGGGGTFGGMNDGGGARNLVAGQGGVGGGGTGAGSTIGTDATSGQPNTGGGGGASNSLWGRTPGSGGSGLVVVRWVVST